MESNPYRTPVAPLETTPATDAVGTYGPFRDNGPLKYVLIGLLLLDSMFVIFNSGVLNYLAIKQYESDEYWLTDEPSQLDNIMGLIGASHGFLILITAIVFVIWINRSCKNAWLLDPPRMSITPSWSIGYYFIPIVNFWKPYVSMKEIRSSSYGSDHALRGLMPIWWALWIISSILGLVVFRIHLTSDNDESYLMASKLAFVSVPVDVILNYIAIILITGVTAAQKRRLSQWHA
ncbi:MAG: DUF4328 domain-containing protein [Akkermansiaceae bacterium]|jgi:hypothetical protein|tara:strand:- start:31387 stop:32088 length:702 start_codon:yes stop_codon:yes gene_type:complete